MNLRSCDFCGDRLKNGPPQIEVWDSNRFKASDYDACDTCAFTVVAVLEDLKKIPQAVEDLAAQRKLAAA